MQIIIGKMLKFVNKTSVAYTILCRDVVVRGSTLKSVNMGSFSLSIQTKDFKNGIHSCPA